MKKFIFFIQFPIHAHKHTRTVYRSTHIAEHKNTIWQNKVESEHTIADDLE
jgi:hypothetical protein